MSCRLTDQELESDRVERIALFKEDNDKIKEAVCAFANDLTGHRKSGILFIGIHDDLRCANLEICDKLLQSLAAMKSDGNITPFASLTVQKRIVNGCELAIATADPADAPPVRCKGRVYIRVGPTRGRRLLGFSPVQRTNTSSPHGPSNRTR